MKSEKQRFAAVIATAALLLCIAPVFAQSGDDLFDEVLEQFEGQFDTREDLATMQAHIERGIEAATADMNFIARPIARNRLRAVTTPCMSFTFSFDDDNVTYQCEDQPPHVSPIDGRSVRREAAHGREAHVLTHVIEEDRIIQTMRAEDGGVRRTVFELDLTGTAIRATTTITSDQLNRPVRYSLEYNRVQ
jgi:hypothetical protein